MDCQYDPQRGQPVFERDGRRPERTNRRDEVSELADERSFGTGPFHAAQDIEREAARTRDARLQAQRVRKESHVAILQDERPPAAGNREAVAPRRSELRAAPDDGVRTLREGQHDGRATIR